MNTIEVVVAHVQGLSGRPDELTHLHTLLKQSEEVLQSNASQLGQFLDQLDPSKHSLGYLYILEAHLSAPTTKERAGELVPSIARFITSCLGEQIRLAPEKFISICKYFKDEVVQRQSPLAGVAPMRAAVRKLQSSSEHLTTLHPDFLLLCLLAKCYKAGLSILEDDVFEVHHPRDFFLYCYYGGMICIGQKHFCKAIELLHNVVTAPMTSLNAIAVEAHKKYILVSLIHNGQFSTAYPKYTSSVAQRNLKSFCQILRSTRVRIYIPSNGKPDIYLIYVNDQPYYDLASSYGTGKIAELESCVATHAEKFESDNNLGLVKQVVSSLYKRNIQRLTQTYLTLSLQDIANTVQLNTPKEAEMHVLQMIQDGEIFATINQKDGMVSFHEDPEQYKSCEMIENIDSSIQRIMVLSKKLNTVHEVISCDPAYLGKAGRERQRFDIDDFDSVPQRFNM